MRDGLTEDELSQAKNKVLARSVLRSERPMGRLASLGFHWMYRRAYISVEAGARGLQSRHARRPAPAAARLAALAADDRLGRPDDRRPTAGVTARRDRASLRPAIASEPASSCGSSACSPRSPSWSATWARGDDLVGVTHECDYPAGVEKLPHLTRSRIPGAATSARDRRAGQPAGREPVRAGRRPARRADAPT